jgi:excisionase family DNA binding protein
MAPSTVEEVGRMGAQIAIAEQTSGPIALSKQEAAQMLGVSVRTVDRLIALKELRVRRLGRRVLVPRTSLEMLIRADHPTRRV